MKTPLRGGLFLAGTLSGILVLRCFAATESTPEHPAASLSWITSEVIKLKRAGVSTEIQKAFVENSPHATPPTSDELLELNRLKVDDSVILSLLATTSKLAAAPPAASNAQASLAPIPTTVTVPYAASVTTLSQPAPQVVYSPAPVYYSPSLYPSYYYDSYPYWGYSYNWPSYGYYHYPGFQASFGWRGGGGGYHYGGGGGGGHAIGHGGRPPVGHPGGTGGGGGFGGGRGGGGGGHRGR